MEKIVIAVVAIIVLAMGLFLFRHWGRANNKKNPYDQRINEINRLQNKFENLSDKELKELTSNFRSELDNGTPLDDILVRAFAAVREAARRTLKITFVDVQLMGGMVLHDGKIAEMKTGEGKTLVATLPAYLNALSGKGVHVITVNDYLAGRDAEWMRPVFTALGMTVGLIQQDMLPRERRENYLCDITYATNSELGFDYLRDNMAASVDEVVQRPFQFCVIDEVDSILIDEARTPLIISGQVERPQDKYQKAAALVEKLSRSKDMSKDGIDPEGDYEVDEKQRSCILTDEGIAKTEKFLNVTDLFDPKDPWAHYVTNALKAKELFVRDTNYIVRDNEAVIVDEFTGRVMPGRRWSDGQHQAIEAKEKLAIQPETQTLASITYQNFFLLYPRLSGMTATATRDALEFKDVYNLEVDTVPTYKPIIRDDRDDLVFIDQQSKLEAIVKEIKTCIEKQQPVLVGTASIETSQLLSDFLNKAKIKHAVLNAKQPEHDAGIIAQAGLPGAITIATNMAGRGTDIVLGGNLNAELAEVGEGYDALKAALRKDWERRHKTVIKAGGLHVIGAERHESRRIDNQLRGLSGVRGQAGSSQFYLSLEDNLLRIFGGDRMKSLMIKIKTKPGESIRSRMLSRAIETAQRKVERHYFHIRKQVLQYDEVMNNQRKAVYTERRRVLDGKELKLQVLGYGEFIMEEIVEAYTNQHLPPEEWDLGNLVSKVKEFIYLLEDLKPNSLSMMNVEELKSYLKVQLRNAYDLKEAQIEAANPGMMREAERFFILQQLDTLWREHLQSMDSLRESVGLRGYGQKDPLIEYKNEGYDMFLEMMINMRRNVIYSIFMFQPDKKSVEN